MAAQALYRRWRPQSFDDVYGQEHITRTLRNAVATDRMAHAYLFTGLRGTGKTSVARILAKAVNCTGADETARPCNECSICEAITAGRLLDLIEIDAASNTGVDDVRELRDKIGFAPNEARFKVYIIDEVHMLSTAAFNALLKTLEEPPDHALFILATTEPHKIPDTILSRCQRHDFRRIGVTEVAAKLAVICAAEGIDASKEALERIARSGTGSLRDAESLLDQVIATGDGVTLEHVRDALGTPGGERVAAMVDALIAGDAAAALRHIGEAVDQGADPAQMRGSLLEHLRGLLLLQTGADDRVLDVPEELLATMRDQAAALPTSHLVATIHRVNDARPSPDRSQPTLPLELALVEAVLDVGASAGLTLPVGGAVAAPAVAPAQASPAAASPAAASPAAAATSTGDATASKPKPRAAKPQTQAQTLPADASSAESSAPATQPAAAKPVAAPAATTAPAATAATEGQVSDERTGAKAEPKSDPASSAAPSTAAPAPAPAASAPAPGTSKDTAPGTPFGATLEELREQWPKVLATVAQHDRNTAALLKDCRPVSIEGDEVVLGFFYEFHGKRAGEAARQAAIAKAIGDVMGTRPRLRLTVVPAGSDDRKGRPRSKSERAGADPVVRHALEQLGAQITSVQTDPEEEG